MLTTLAGVNSLFLVYFSICFRVLFEMLSFGKFLILLRKSVSERTLLASSQVGVLLKRIITASIVFCTSTGGFVYAFTSDTDPLSSFSTALNAASRAGSAYFRSSSASPATISTSLCSFSILFDSLTTVFSESSACLCFYFISIIKVSHFFCCFCTCSLFMLSSCCISYTYFSAVSSFSNPPRSLSLWFPISVCLIFLSLK